MGKVGQEEVFAVEGSFHARRPQAEQCEPSPSPQCGESRSLARIVNFLLGMLRWLEEI